MAWALSLARTRMNSMVNIIAAAFLDTGTRGAATGRDDESAALTGPAYFLVVIESWSKRRGAAAITFGFSCLGFLASRLPRFCSLAMGRLLVL